MLLYRAREPPRDPVAHAFKRLIGNFGSALAHAVSLPSCVQNQRETQMSSSMFRFWMSSLYLFRMVTSVTPATSATALRSSLSAQHRGDVDDGSGDARWTAAAGQLLFLSGLDEFVGFGFNVSVKTQSRTEAGNVIFRPVGMIFIFNSRTMNRYVRPISLRPVREACPISSNVRGTPH